MRVKAAIACALFLLTSEIALAVENRLALVIGNSMYRHTSILKNPSNDANLIGRVLEANGFQTTVEIDLSRDRMREVVDTFASELVALGGSAVGVFYYAGHGIQVDGKNFLIPVDGRVDTRGSLEQALSLDWVTERLGSARNVDNIIILDACRNNPFPTVRSATRSVSRGLASVGKRTGTLVAFATAPDTVAADGDGDNSPYASALAEFMQMPGLHVEQVFKQVRLKVQTATNFRQTPWESSSLTSDIILSDRKPSVPSVASCATQSGPYRVVDVAQNDVLNVRKGAGVEFSISHTLKPDETGITMGECNSDQTWCVVTTRCLTGWVARRHIAASIITGSVESFSEAPSQGLFRVSGVAANDVLNVREAGSHRAPIRFSIPPYATNIQVGVCALALDGTGDWCAVTFAKRSGYVSARYLRHMETNEAPRTE